MNIQTLYSMRRDKLHSRIQQGIMTLKPFACMYTNQLFYWAIVDWTIHRILALADSANDEFPQFFLPWALEWNPNYREKFRPNTLIDYNKKWSASSVQPHILIILSGISTKSFAAQESPLKSVNILYKIGPTPMITIQGDWSQSLHRPRLSLHYPSST